MTKRKLIGKMKLPIVMMIIFALLVTSITLTTGLQEASAAVYNSQYKSKAEAVQAGAELNIRIAEEGTVLLKNDGGALPLWTRKGSGGAKVTLFGAKAYYPNGGGADGGENSVGAARISTNITESLKDANITINPKVSAEYKAILDPKAAADRNDWAIRESISAKFDSFEGSYGAYSDAAIVVLSGTSAATKDDGRTGTVAGAIPAGKTAMHSRMLDSAQFALLDEVCANFDKVIIIINDSRPIELSFLNDSAKYPQIKAALLTGEPGENGFAALGQILVGNVNPSGRLVDIYANDFSKDPTWMNFGSNFRTNGATYTTNDGTLRTGSNSVDYEEGIYLGYRYYETRGFTANDADVWYNANVVYPFGYGKSYTTFDWTLTGNTTGNITEKSEISVQVKVENTGEVAGKEVIQLYYTAPYTGGIEKSHVVLGDFVKTKLLAPGESEIVSLRMSAIDMASYDWSDKNTNSFKGYELENGTYTMKLMSDSHNVKASFDLNVATAIKCDKSKTTGNTVENRFDDVNNVILGTSTVLTSAGLKSKTVLSRKDWAGTFPTTPTADELKISDADFAYWDVTKGSGTTAGANAWLPSSYDSASDPWYSATAPAFADPATRSAVAAVQLSQLVGKDFNDPLWNDLLDEISLDEAINLINVGGFNTQAIPYIGKPATTETDGPQGLTGMGWVSGSSAVTRFATEPVVASTFNKELAYEIGVMIGEQGIWGNADNTSGTNLRGYNGWYAPAMNGHRSPFESRYTEYYSEDGVLAGMMAANSSLGANSMGCYVYIKHFALHEYGNTDLRGTMMGNTPAGRASGLAIWANEQVMRELYFKPFQIAVEKGGARAAMTSFSRIGYTWAGGSYALLTQILRNEWGFKGMVIDDIELYSFTNAQQAIRAGGDLHLSGYNNNNITRLKNDAAVNTPTQLTAIRRAVKNILYVTANSNVMQIPKGAAIRYVAKTLADGAIGVAYDQTVAATGISGDAAKGFYWNTQYTGYSARNFTVTSGVLPAGVTLTAATGAIAGTPTAAGTYTFTITCSATGYTSANASFTMTIAAASLSAPANIKMTNDTVSWDAVTNATGYVVEIAGGQYAVTGTSLALPVVAAGTYSVKVKAIDTTGAYQDSSTGSVSYTTAGPKYDDTAVKDKISNLEGKNADLEGKNTDLQALLDKANVNITVLWVITAIALAAAAGAIVIIFLKKKN